MANKSPEKLSRRELLKLLREEQKKNAELLEELDELDALLDKAEAELESKHLAIARCGTMAQAALELNGVIEAADAAAKQYVANVRIVTEASREAAAGIEAEAKERARVLLERTEQFCRSKCAEVDKRCDEWREKTSEECRLMLEETEAKCKKKTDDADRYWAYAARHAKQSGILNDFKNPRK